MERVVFPAVCLPTDRNWVEVERPTYEGRQGFALSPELSGACRDYAHRNGVQPASVLLAGWRAFGMRHEGRLGEAHGWTFEKLLRAPICQNGPFHEPTLGFEVGGEGETDLIADLVLSIQDSPDAEVTATLRFRRDLFDDETITRLTGRFTRLMRELLAHPNAGISEAGLISSTEERQILEGWNNTRTDYPRDCSVPCLFDEIAREHASRLAIVDGSHSLTYADLNARANIVAAHLVGQGVEPGARVGIACQRSMASVISMLAVLKTGAAYVPLDASYPLERIRFMIGDTQPTVIIIDRTTSPSIFGAVRTVDLDRLMSLPNDATTFTGPIVTAESSAYIMYTSGSTGTPKGVEVLHRGIVRLVRGAKYVALGPQEVFAQISNSSFDAITFEVWGALLNGARLVILPKDIVLSPDGFAAAIQRHGVTTMFITTALFHLMASRCPSAFRTVHHLLMGGEVLDPRLARRILNSTPPRHMVHVYGPTECTTFSLARETRDIPEDANSVPIGRPIENSQAYILDSNGKLAPAGVPGELYLGGDGLAKGYWNRPDITAQVFVPSPFDRAGTERLYKTGDLASYRADGEIEFLGRADNQVKIRGFRIELGEIETVLRQHAEVSECVVLAVPDPAGGKRLVAYLTRRPGQQPAIEEIRRYLKGRLPEFMLPSAMIFVEELPLNPNGKVDRRKLPPIETAVPSRTADQPATMTETQQLVAAIWRKVLRVSAIGLDDNFFDIGGDSLRLAAVESELKSQVQARFSITDLFEHPTIRTFAARLNGSQKQPNLTVDAQDRARRQQALVESMRAVPRGSRP